MLARGLGAWHWGDDVRHRYSDEERADALLALEANGGNLSRTARQMGIPRATLRLWAQGNVVPAVTDICQAKKGTPGRPPGGDRPHPTGQDYPHWYRCRDGER